MHSPVIAPTEHFTQEEQTALEPYFGNSNSSVFVLTNLPEVVKGALSHGTHALQNQFVDFSSTSFSVP